jgi:hypothetical protein
MNRTCHPDCYTRKSQTKTPMKLDSIRAIKHAYNEGLIRSRAAAVAVARLFPCLQHLYPDDYDANTWSPEQLATTSRKLSTGEAECAKLVIFIYNYAPMVFPKAQAASKWKCGLFNLAEFATCDQSARDVLIQWLQDPLFL